MFVFKSINPSDISTVETTVYKTQSLDSGSAGIKSTQYRSGSKKVGSDVVYNASGSYWNSLHILFYQSGSNLRSAESSSFDQWSYSLAQPHAVKPQHVNKFYVSGSILSIPQKYFGERIKPGSFKLIDNSTSKEVTIQDDGHGNLYPVGHTISQSVTSPSSSDNYVGNIFYNYGIVTVTDTGSYSASINYADVTTDKYTLKFESTQTIYTYEYLVTINPEEFNFTMNPTARAFHSGSDLTNPIETPYLRSRLTASGWTPSVTSIQLYSEHQKGLGTFETKPNRLINLTEPIIVAKLPNPIKIPSDMQITFRVRLDF
jgi:hypothetical protein